MVVFEAKASLRGPAFLGKRQSPGSDDVVEAGISNASLGPHTTTKSRYKRLRGDHCIRLLTLFPCSNEDDQIVCTLKVHDFDEAVPEFTALSYTWGTPKDPRSILLNGHRAVVRSNLHAALTHIRHATSERVLWIDALCINQQSIKERNQQVPLMRDIYMVVEDVLVWLRPATPGIDLEDSSAVFTDLVSWPYWTRVWVIQEFVLGRKTVLQCGDTLYDWDELNKSFPQRGNELTEQTYHGSGT